MIANFCNKQTPILRHYFFPQSLARKQKSENRKLKSENKKNQKTERKRNGNQKTEITNHKKITKQK